METSTLLSVTVRTCRQKIRDIEDVNNTISQLDLLTIDRPVLTNSAHGTFTNIDHILRQKARFKTEKD